MIGMKRVRWQWVFIGFVGLVSACGPKGKQASRADIAPTQADISPVDPCAIAREIDPHCGWKPHWDDSGPIVNALDGTRKEFLSLESANADGTDGGRLSYALLRLCFHNEKPCGENALAVAFTVNGTVQSIDDDNRYKTSVRFRFDADALKKQSWTIADSRDAFGPTPAFILQLLQHQKLIMEFSYDQRGERTLTFDIEGLAKTMETASLKP